MTRIAILLVGIFFIVVTYNPASAQTPTWKNVRVLVYTKNGKGFVHDNIPFAVAAIQKLGQQHGFRVDVSDQPAVMTEANLNAYTLLIFTSTNNDVFDTDAQRLAFRRYIEAGGGFVGVHSVMGTERNWTWFKQMLGGTFAWHARFQTYPIRMIDARHPSMEGLPKVWQKADECYFAKELWPGPTVLMAHDFSNLNPADSTNIRKYNGGYATLYPAVWQYDFDGGYTWCTALGHDKADYADPTYVRHLFQGIRYVAGRIGKLDYSRAYATTHDAPLR